MFPNIDVIIPCYNTEKTLIRAVESVLNQPCLGKIWLIDDASSDETLALANQLSAQYPERIFVESMNKNGGVAKARNWGALQSTNELIAFLDADDAYEQGALEVAAATFHFQPDTSLVRLALKPVGLAQRYAEHPNFDFAWQYMRMTCGGNVVFRRAFFLACGGFPQNVLFRELGGEDGALGIATTRISKVATLFDEVGVLHYCREGMHAERLLDSILFQKVPEGVTEEKMMQANAVTDEICRRMEALKCGLNSAKIGIQPLILTRSEA
ncbi:glycosyltransferase family A protein [Rodentibacter pneumotropicus]|uniref:glycosyltransferase family A protein n=1 Tax=Rodentibacter pneumotropicus TaxID=758 RepID=UPI0009847EC6|nr:glycosyltransferase family A protein [Rodentibacter pneumotropicus]OOF63949.1 glycosyltransferase [Rodentibacter pneumotropicus]THA18868.1 glycosyltransferase family 2 protein [Rodentibacter pneumotropicus]